MSSRQSNSKKTTKKSSSRSSKRKSGLFKKKTIKPKVKLDSNKVLLMCAAIMISCAILVIATVLIPAAPENYSSKLEQSQVREEQVQKNDSQKKSSDSKTKSDSKSKNKQTSTKVTKEKSSTQKENQIAKDSSSNKQSQQTKTDSSKAEDLGKKTSEEQTKIAKPVTDTIDPLYLDIPDAKNNAKLVFVFDDAGNNLNQLKKFLTLPFPITIAILPQLEHSKESGRLIRSSGKEAILHQPMQSVNLNINPGPGAIKPDMSVADIQALLKANIAEVGPVAGLNNHEGSLITEDEMRIGAVLEVANQMGIYFLDSRTSSQTRVPQAAMSMGLGYYQRDIFLDNEKTKKNIITELKKGLAIANKKGHAIMIGHIWSSEILPAVLMDVYPILKEKGYRFTTVTSSGGLIHP